MKLSLLATILLLPLTLTILMAFHLVYMSQSLTGPPILIQRLARNRSEQCKIPELDPWDTTIMEYYRKMSPLKCKPVQPRLVYIAHHKLVWDAAIVRKRGYASKYRCLTKTRDDKKPKFGDFQDAPNNTALRCELVHVKCSHGILRGSVFDKYISHVIADVEKTKSRSNFIRQLPMTYDYLVNKLGTYDFRSFNKAAFNSYANAMALLEDAKVDGLATSDQRGPYDNRPMIFHNYSKMGYITQYSIDWPKTDLFNYKWRGNGFLSDRPFDHYDRPLWLAMWNSWRSDQYCYDDTPKHKIVLDYINEMFEAYPAEIPKFSLSWFVDIGHDYVNDVGKMDLDLLHFTQRLQPYLNNSFFMLMGDHGQRVDHIRESQTGRLEDRLPFFSMVAPLWFRTKYPERVKSLHTNANGKLSTFYDVFATLAEILHETYTTETQYPVAKGISLFRDIPRNRSCADASIDANDCACSSTHLIPDDHQYAQIGSISLLTYLNSMTEVTRGGSNSDIFCTMFTRIDQRYSFLELPGQLDNLRTVRLTMTSSVQPGNGLFESRVIIDVQSLTGRVERVDRINRYGNQSHCVNATILKPVCYCSDLSRQIL